MTGADLDKPNTGPERCAITKKICHKTRASAVEHGMRQRKLAKKGMTGKVSILRCGYCDMYHLGRR